MKVKFCTKVLSVQYSREYCPGRGKMIYIQAMFSVFCYSITQRNNQKTNTV